MTNNNTISINKFFVPILLIIILFSSVLLSQPRSKIEGKVKDAQTKEEMIGVNIYIPELSIGAASDIRGNFVILNVPVGTYELHVSMIGYSKVILQNVIVSADRTTTLEIDITSTAIQSEEIVVTAKRDPLHKEVSNTQIVVTNDQLVNSAGVRDVSTFLLLQPGVSASNGFLEIRGGSAEQTGTFINGMSYNNAAVGNAETTIPLSSVDQVSLLSGGFNAEYGNFRSGLINVTTKSGSKERYHGTFTVSRNIAHQKRFGPSFSDPFGPALAPYLDAKVAFVGTAVGWADDPYKQEQHESFEGWNRQAELFNANNPRIPATPLDYYLLAAWMHMAIPDYEGLAALGYTVPEEQKKLFEERARKEQGVDFDIDAGFGGPIPFFSKQLGDATFYLSHTTKEKHYIAPVTRQNERTHVTLGTIRSNPLQTLSLNFNFLWKRQLGMSPLKPAFGDMPDATREGGFMPIDNQRQFYRLSTVDGGVNYWFDQPIFPMLDQTTVVTGFTANKVLSKNTFFDASVSYSSIKDHSPVGDNRSREILTRFGPFPVTEMPYGKLQYAGNNRVTLITPTDTITYLYPGNDALPGSARRFRSKEGDLYTNVHVQQYRAKFDLVSQIGKYNYFKTGIEYNLFDIDHKMWLKWNNNAYNTYEYNYHRLPSQTGFYIQDQISSEGIVANLGFRLDYFYGGGGKWPSGDPFNTDAFVNSPFREIGAGSTADSFYNILASGRSIIWEHWEEYDRQNPGFLQPIKNHFTFSPRLGVAFPVTETSKFYFNYGHFRSTPPYYSMYLVQYRYTKNGVYEMSNPNLAPPKTISYELGFGYNFYENYLLNISGYYKDVTGQHGGVNYRNALGTIDYDTWDNNNYEDIQGFEINITKNDPSWISGWINFNYMMKKSGLTGREVITDISINDDKIGLYNGTQNRFLPLPRLTSSLSLLVQNEWFGNDILKNILGDWRVTLLGEWRAGSYFTWNPLGKPHVSSNLQWPDFYMLDLRLNKTFNVAGLKTTLFVDVNNVLNIKVSQLSRGIAFNTLAGDDVKYMASLRLPMYDSPEFDDLRASNPGLYLPGNDKVGDLRSDDKPYINDPNHTYFLFGRPRDIWFGMRVDF